MSCYLIDQENNKYIYLIQRVFVYVCEGSVGIDVEERKRKRERDGEIERGGEEPDRQTYRKTDRDTEEE